MVIKIIKKIILFIVFIITITFVLFEWYDQSRKYFCLSENKCITVWKRVGGRCFIVFGKYRSCFQPENNYIITTNDNSVTFVVGESISYDYAISNDYGKNFNIVMPKVKIKYYPQKLREEFEREYYENNKPKKGLEAFSIDIKEDL